MHFLIAMLLQAQPAQSATPPEPTPAVSLDRIRQALEEPPTTITVLSSDPTVPPLFRMDIKERRLPYEQLWEGDYLSSHVRPVRGLTHHEFLEQVTPELFRSTSMYPCCPVLPLLNLLRGDGSSRKAESKAREEVKKALRGFLEAQKKAQ